MLYVGWDWAAESHDVTVMNTEGAIVDRWSVTHDAGGIDAALRRLVSHGDPGESAVAIETRKGLVVGRLIAAGFAVVPIHPNSFNATRPRWGASRAKSDPGDSWKLADYVRTDGHRLARLDAVATPTADLQALCRARDDLVEAKIGAMNQLDAKLATHWPGATRVFFSLDSDVALSFLERYPTQASASRLGPGRMRQFCERVGYTGRRSPVELIDRLRSAPTPAATRSTEALAAIVMAHVSVLRQVLTSLRTLEAEITAAVKAHPKSAVLATLPRVGRINLAQIIGEVGPILDSAIDVDHACAQVGASPVTRESGKQRHVSFRWTANTRARKALITFADNSRHDCPWAADRYAAARSRNKRHPHAVRIVARSWLRVIWACWHTDTAYDPNHHRQPVLAAAG